VTAAVLRDMIKDTPQIYRHRKLDSKKNNKVGLQDQVPEVTVRLHKEILNFNPLNAELNPICYLLALLGVHHFLHVSRIRVKSLTLRLLMSYIWSTYS